MLYGVIMVLLKSSFLILALFGIYASALEKLACTFDELNLCNWTQSEGTLPWRFGNYSWAGNTGPKQPLNERGRYIFVSSYEGDQSNNEKIARIESPTVHSYQGEFSCFSFYYHMFGARVGELRVIMVPMKDEKIILHKQIIWRRRGTQPDKWMQFKESLNEIGNYRLEIEAEGGPGFAGSIAVDEILAHLGGCGNSQDICDFESGLCGWNVESNRNFYWLRRSGRVGNGPVRDHTTLTEAGYYLEAVVEQGAAVGSITNFVSPQYGERWGPHCLTFWYYRPGLGTGKLSVIIRRNAQDMLHWSATQDVGKSWRYGQVNVHQKSSFQLVFKAEKGSNNDHRMAIDDIIVKNSVCGEPASCNFNFDYCGYDVNGTSDFAWLLGTGRVANTQLIDTSPDDNSIKDGMYVYADMSSPNLKEGQNATLVSEILEPTYSVPSLSFVYYLNGADKASLSVGKLVPTVGSANMVYRTDMAFSTSRKTDRGWAPARITIPTRRGENYQLFFTATRGDGPQSIVALDDIFLDDKPCTRRTTKPPVISTEMPQSLVSCDFENNNFCSWEIEKNNLQFRISALRRGKNWMPAFDHTKWPLGRYAYVEGDNVSKKKAAITLSRVPKWDGNFCFSFWYNMDVVGKSRLSVSATPSNREDYVDYWSREGNYIYGWSHAYVQIRSSVQSPKMKITAEVKRGVIAVDDLSAKKGACPISKICTFDEDDNMCGYSQDATNTLDWDIKAGEDKSIINRMPDHTTHSLKGRYLYVGFNGNTTTPQRSRIYSPKRSPAEESSCVTFYYHIYYVSRLSFNAYFATDNGLSDPLWSASISQGLYWHGARFSVPLKTFSWQAVFEVSVGSHGYGQVAIDDISVTDGKCPDPGYCDFESEDCLWENARPAFVGNNTELRNAVSVDVAGDLLKADFDWIRCIANDFYGARRDKTLGSGQGFYLALDTMFVTAVQKAVYVSERLQTSSGACLKMWYSTPNYHNGASLQVLSSSDFLTARQEKLIRTITYDKWTEKRVTIIPEMTSDSSVLHYWIFLVGYAGKTDAGCIAIDDIRIKDGVCENDLETTEVTLSTTEFMLSTTEESTETVTPEVTPYTIQKYITTAISQYHCETGHKLCYDKKKCIPGLLLCDGVEDCEDGSDESYGCNKASLCDEGFYFCNDRAYPPCIHRKRVCDGNNDCSDGSDESLCYKCIDTYCQNGGNCSVHDRKLVCRCQSSFYHNRCSKRATTSPEPEDTKLKTLNPETTKVMLSTTEESTGTAGPRRYCEKGYKLCNDGQQCIPGLLLCDGVKDCEDGSDELYSCSKESLCDKGFYFCSDRAYPPCIHRERVCDGFDDCSDGSDESLCDKCIGTFCQNGGNCSVHDRKPVCRCKSTFNHNRCTKRIILPEPEDRFKTLFRYGLIVGMAIADILLIAITFFVCCRRRTNAEPE